MKNRNPYLNLLIFWIVVICTVLTSCIFYIFNGVIWQALFNLALVVIDSIFLGFTICKFNQFRELQNSLKQFDDYLQMLIDKEKIKENEPFKEFEENEQ